MFTRERRHEELYGENVRLRLFNLPYWLEYHVDSRQAESSYIPEGHQTSLWSALSRLKNIVV